VLLAETKSASRENREKKHMVAPPDLQTRLTQGMTFAQLLERSRHASLLLAFLEAAPPEPLPEEVAWVLALVEVQTAEKQPTNPHTSSLGPLPQMNRFSAPSPSKGTRLHGGPRRRRKGVK
jgi:hypothetical protein